MSAGATTLDRIIRSIVTEATSIAGDSVIPANEPYPAPAGLYATVLRASGHHRGTPGTTFALSEDEEEVVATSTVIVRTHYSVNFYRNGAVEQAEALRAWLSTPLGILKQTSHKIRVAEHSAVRRLDEMIQEEPEERAQIDLEIDSPLTLVQNIGRVRTVPFDTRLGENDQQGEIENGP